MEKIKLLYIGNNPDLKKDYAIDESVFEVEQKENGFLAFSYLNTAKSLPDVILVENDLKGINPYEFSKSVRKNSQFNSIVLLVFSKQIPTKKESEKSLKIGIDDLVTKPFSFTAFLPRLQFLIDYRKNQIQLNRNKSAKRTIPLEKRIFDIVFASLALLLLSPLFILVAIAIRLESKGPVFYASKRVGTGYKIFDFYKFRSMYPDADKRLKEFKKLNQYAEEVPEIEEIEDCPKCKALGKPCSQLLYIDGKEICESQYLEIKHKKNAAAFFKLKDEPRVTKVGRFIRNTSIDELPQLFNVLKGDMSIVGNRPLPLYEAEQLTSDQWSERFLAPAGITGLWQVEKRGGGEMSDEERKQLDNTYARNYSLWYDIKLIFRTIPALLQKENV
ncbi:MAG TPA: sugar transferase [Flavobacteriales bacterium]|nr:sugar transferase [Flavobacteriales bacterium]